MRLEAARSALGIVAMVVAAGTAGAAQRGAGGMNTAPVDSHDLSGYWQLSYDSRKIPPAEFAPGVTKTMIDAHTKQDAHAIRWCNLLGLPFIMDAGVPLDIRVGTREMIIDANTASDPRHIYFRAQHINPDIFDPSTIGDSIGHWEGDTLVVDTVGFNGKRGLTTIPGGGFRTDDSHLVERYNLLENGSVLSVAFTWTDPKVYRTPHTYEFRYYRLPKLFEPLGAIACNPYDEVRSKFLEDPTVAAPTISKQ